MVRKAEVLRSLVALYRAPRYLEIGVARGKTFHAIQASRKVAVDPAFRFHRKKARQANPRATYHETTSDDYFGQGVQPKDRFDVIYLDGLHTFEQTLRDFCNAIHFLSDRGVIVIDDVVPNGPYAAIPDRARFLALRAENPAIPAAWMGDVYKLVYFIETFFQQYTYRTVSDNLGQLVVWKARRSKIPARSAASIAEAAFEDVAFNRDSFNFAPFAEILSEVASHVRRPAPASPAWFWALARDALKSRPGM